MSKAKAQLVGSVVAVRFCCYSEKEYATYLRLAEELGTFKD